MKNRLVSAVIIGLVTLSVFVAAMFVSWALNVVLLILAAVALYECFQISGCFQKPPLVMASYLFAVAFMFVSTLGLRYALMAISLYIPVLVCIMVYNHVKYTFSDISFVLMITLYITLGFSSLGILRDKYNETGILLVFLVVLGAWASDIGGWLFGMLFGKHKLSPVLSPQKTVEGAVGSFVVCMGVFAGAAAIYSAIADKPIQLLYVALISIPFTAATIVGDLAASALKREHGAKDFSQLLPGHGGIMDRFDSLLMSSILMLILFEFIGGVKAVFM